MRWRSGERVKVRCRGANTSVWVGRYFLDEFQGLFGRERECVKTYNHVRHCSVGRFEASHGAVEPAVHSTLVIDPRVVFFVGETLKVYEFSATVFALYSESYVIAYRAIGRVAAYNATDISFEMKMIE